MKFYAAPMEGVTGYNYRNAHHHFYPGVDRYFTPFLSPKMKKGMNSREKNDVLPEHNKGVPVIPQILTNQASDFVEVSQKLQDMGYGEVNLNLGCPSGTVVSKGKGCGFLKDRDQLRQFFEDCMDGFCHNGLSGMKMSVKTRLGVDDPEEILKLMEIYNDYPLSELIIHARIHKDFYKKPVNRQAFREAVDISRHPVCYNGDLFSPDDLKDFREQFPEIDTVMMGRGLIANPQLIEMCQNGESAFDYDRFFQFHDEILKGYIEIMSGERNVLFKMKELWNYMDVHFPGQEKLMKKIRKAKNLMEYNQAMEALSH